MKASWSCGASIRALGLCLLLGTSAGVQAQAAPTGSAQQPTTPSSEPPAPDSGRAQAGRADTAAPRTTGDTAADSIVVTGSRVIRNGNEAPQPVTLVRTEELLKQTPTTVADGLNALPVFAGSRGPGSQTVSPTGTGGNPSANTLDIRGLGANRNLILFDGQRLPSALFTGVVDVDIVPDPLLDRVDVVTGGVSAVYGSDAVSGVVNFVPTRKFNGIKAEADVGLSQKDDAPQHKFEIAGGTNLGEHGHVEASFSHFDSDPLFYRTDRPFGFDAAIGGLQSEATNGPAGTVNNPYVFILGGRNDAASFGGKATIGGKDYSFDANGVMTPFNYGVRTAGTAPGQLYSNLSIGGDGYYNNGSFSATQRNNQAYGRFDYDLVEGLHFHTQGIASIKNNEFFQNYGVISNYTIRATNPFLPAATQAALAAANQQYFTFSKAFQDGPRLQDNAHTEQYFVNAGFDGKLANFDWAADIDWAKVKIHNQVSGNVNNQHMAAALDSTTNAAGQVVCRINAVTVTDASCVPLNPFGPTSASPAALAYVFGTTNTWITSDSFDANGHIGGDLFNLGAGAARFDLSGSYRSNSLEQSVDVSSLDVANCTGLVINPTPTSYANNCIPAGALSKVTSGSPVTATPLFVNAFAPLSKVTQKVKEAALELLVPLLKDSAIARQLDVDGAIRYADYNTSGRTWVWKGGVNWRVFNDLRLRGTISRDFRAPTLYDLYQPVTTGIANNADQLTGVSFLQIRSQGNPNLKPEIGHTWTVGGVYSPSFVPGLSFAVDYYHIDITNAIQSVGGQTPAIQQLCLQSGGTSVYCQLQPRPNGYTDTSASNAPFYWLSEKLNFASLKTKGIDADINYSHRLGGMPFSARLLVTWQPHLIFGDQPAAAGAATSFDAAGTANANGTINDITPKVRANASIHIEPARWLALDIQERYRSSLRYDPISTDYFAQRVPSAAWTNLAVTLKGPADRDELFLNVENALNKTPPPWQQGILPGQGFIPGDDPIGRYFVIGARVKF